MRVRWAVLASFPRDEQNGFLGFENACFNRAVFASLPTYVIVVVALAVEPEPGDPDEGWTLAPVVTGPDLRPISNVECVFPAAKPPAEAAIVRPRLRFGLLQQGPHRIAWRSADSDEAEATTLWVSTPVTPILGRTAQSRVWGSALEG
jgi:hypothetical protein